MVTHSKKLNSQFNLHLFCTFLTVLLSHSDSKNNLYCVCYIFMNNETVGFFVCSIVTDLFPSFENPRNHNIFCATELMVWLTLEPILEEPSKFQMKKEEQFMLIMWTYP